MTTHSSYFLIAHRSALPAEPPSRLLLIPWGRVKATRGDFTLDDSAAAEIIARFTDQGVDLMIDLEHASVPDMNPKPEAGAPAMGWVKSLVAVPGEGLYCEGVEWTPRGAELVRNKEYRYLSPALFQEKETLRPFRIHSIALVNRPSIAGFPPITHKDGSMDDKFVSARYFLNLEATATEEQIMNEFEKYLGQLRTMAGTAANATAEQVVAALKEKCDAGGALSKERLTICKALDVPADAQGDVLLTALADGRGANPAKVVPASELKAATDRLAALESKATEREASEFVTTAMSEGRIHETERPHWLRVFAADAKAAREDMEKIPKGRFAANGVLTKPAAAGAPTSGDPIVAHSEKFDAGRMDAHRRVVERMKADKSTYEQAAEALGV